MNQQERFNHILELEKKNSESKLSSALSKARYESQQREINQIALQISIYHSMIVAPLIMSGLR